MKPVKVRNYLAGWLMFGAAIRLNAQNGPGSPGAGLNLAPAYPEMAPTFWELHHVAILLSAGALVLLLLPLIWFLLRPKPEIIVPPETVAREALLKLSGRPEDGQCLSQVSQILRHYFIAAFEIPAGEPTTAEFCAMLAGHQKISADLKTRVADLLRECDDRKFGARPGAWTLNAVTRTLELIGVAEESIKIKSN